MIRLNQNDIDGFIAYPETFGHWIGYDKLIDLHGYWIQEAHQLNNFSALMAHRKSYKTTSIIVVGFIWNLLFWNPNDTMLYLRKTDEEAVAISGTILQNFEKPQVEAIAYFLYKVNTLRTREWSKSKFRLSIKIETSPEGSVEARGLKGAKQGSHYKKIFADDFINLEDRISKTERKRTLEYISDLTNIVTDDGRIFYSGTPWHPDDAWSKLPKPKMFPIGTVKIPGYSTPEEIALKRKELHESALTKSLIAANYELKHIIDEGRIFGEPKYDKWPDNFKRLNAWLDPAYEGDCTTAVAMIGIDINKTACVRGWVWDKSVVDVYNNIAERLNEYKCGTLYIEDNADKGASTRDMRKIYPAVIGRNEHMNKHIKIISYLKKNYDKLVFADDCQPEFMNQILDYTEDADLVDAPDALAALIREMKLGDSNILDRF
jgi:hypothetical protein